MPDQKISCLTVTKDTRRLPLLKQSILDFCRQSYPNKELVIVSDGSADYAQQIDDWVERLKREEIRHIYVPGQRSLGVIRNISVRHATGEYICQWDDDDLNHPLRLEHQFRYMQQQDADVSFFEDQLQYFYDTRELLWVSWKPDLIPGTLMCRKKCLQQNPYLDLERGEDACLREVLRERTRLAVVSGAGYLTIYTYSGLNVYSRKHHESIRYSHDPRYIVERTGVLREQLRHYNIDESMVELIYKQELGPKMVSSRISRWVRKTKYNWKLQVSNGCPTAPEN